MTKKTAKRLLAVLLSALLLLSLAACGETAVVSSDADNTTVQQTGEQKKDNAAKTDDKQTDAKTNDSKKDAASKAEDAKKDDAKKDEVKQEETAEEKKEEPKQEEPKQEETDEEHKQVIDPATGKDKYQTDPVPPGKPTPVEPEDTTIDTSKNHTCTFSISFATILEHPEKDAMAFLDTFKLNLFAQEVFVFTPKGEIKTMPQGATALDFAFLLHSELGEHCIGAKVNHTLVPLS